jgi:hypothetical protein
MPGKQWSLVAPAACIAVIEYAWMQANDAQLAGTGRHRYLKLVKLVKAALGRCKFHVQVT